MPHDRSAAWLRAGAAGGLLVLRLVVGGSRGAVTVADLAAVLSGGEIAQLHFTLTSIDMQLHLPAAILPGLCLLGVGVVVAATMFRWMAVVVTLAGVLAVLVDTALEDGPAVVAVLVATAFVLWMITRLVRVVAPW